MTYRADSRLALRLLERFVPESGALAGDLIEAFQRDKSATRLWFQVIAAVAIHLLDRSQTIRPLRLVDIQPSDAMERSLRMQSGVRSINVSASPVPGVGGLGLVSLAMLVSCVAPDAWWAILVSALAGLPCAVVMIATRSPSHDPGLTIRPGAADR